MNFQILVEEILVLAQLEQNKIIQCNICKKEIVKEQLWFGLTKNDKWQPLCLKCFNKIYNGMDQKYKKIKGR